MLRAFTPLLTRAGVRRFGAVIDVSFRAFSTTPPSHRTNCAPHLARPLQPSKIETVRTTSPKPKLPKEELLFGATFTDHLLECDWDVEKGWHTPRIIPYGDFAIDPAASVLHYGIEVRCARALSAPALGTAPCPPPHALPAHLSRPSAFRSCPARCRH